MRGRAGNRRASYETRQGLGNVVVLVINSYVAGQYRVHMNPNRRFIDKDQRTEGRKVRLPCRNHGPPTNSIGREIREALVEHSAPEHTGVLVAREPLICNGVTNDGRASAHRNDRWNSIEEREAFGDDNFAATGGIGTGP
jgi:hypothetical protein